MRVFLTLLVAFFSIHLSGAQAQTRPPVNESTLMIFKNIGYFLGASMGCGNNRDSNKAYNMFEAFMRAGLESGKVPARHEGPIRALTLEESDKSEAFFKRNRSECSSAERQFRDYSRTLGIN